jgi:hypothetical protein
MGNLKNLTRIAASYYKTYLGIYHTNLLQTMIIAMVMLTLTCYQIISELNGKILRQFLGVYRYHIWVFFGISKTAQYPFQNKRRKCISQPLKNGNYVPCTAHPPRSAKTTWKTTTHHLGGAGRTSIPHQLGDHAFYL